MLAATRFNRSFIFQVLCLLAIGAGTVLRAQEAPYSASDSASLGVDAILKEGQTLEQSGRWLDALTRYERGLRQFPEADDLKQRKILAHIHCDLNRRLQDPSYLQLVSSLSEQQALEVYQELMAKIRAHYFDEPDWQQVTWRGTANLDIALTRGDFRSRFLQQATEDQIHRFRQLLRSDVNQRRTRTPIEAQQLVAYTARLAQQHLSLGPAVTVSEYCCGGISALDQYSSYLTHDQLDDVYSQIEGNFVGLGVELKTEASDLVIVKVIPSGPAELAGIRPGDRILGVNGVDTSVISPEEAADLLKGEENSYVRLTLKGPDQQVRDVRVLRQRVEVPCVEDARILDPESGTAYFRLTSFQKSTSRDVDAALWKLHRQGMSVLIIDLRGNPGGLLTAAVEVADKFLSQGVIVSTRGRSPREDFDYRAHPQGTWRVPLVILIDHDTASASEILAGAIRDHGRGTVIGERSYGKGSVQGIFPLNTVRSGVRLTTSKFYSPSGQPISERGVLPHRIVQVVAKVNPDDSAQLPMGRDLTDDPMVSAALETARQIVLAARPTP